MAIGVPHVKEVSYWLRNSPDRTLRMALFRMPIIASSPIPAAPTTQSGKTAFVELLTNAPVQQRKKLVTKLHSEAISTPPHTVIPPAADFVLMTKKLTMLGFFMSEPGCTQVLQYVAVPGGFKADIPLSEAGNGRAWAVETELKI